MVPTAGAVYPRPRAQDFQALTLRARISRTATAANKASFAALPQRSSRIKVVVRQTLPARIEARLSLHAAHQPPPRVWLKNSFQT